MMKKPKAKSSEETWKKVKFLGEQQGSIKLTDLAHELGLDENDTLTYLRQLFPEGQGAQVYQDKDECWVDLNGEALQYMLPLTPGEWIHLHDLLEHSEKSHPTTSGLLKKITEDGPIKVVMELLHQLELWDHQLTGKQQSMVKELDEATGLRQLVKITTDGKSYNLFPCKVTHLEGQLSLIAEDAQDHCIMILPVKSILSWSTLESSLEPRVSAFEIEEFINAVRSMSEKETRLILKIYDPHSVNLFPDHHFLGKPCMITNPEGDLIWAAYVEPCEALFEWIMSLGKNVDILDPVRFKQEYLIYCEEKLRKVA